MHLHQHTHAHIHTHAHTNTHKHTHACMRALIFGGPSTRQVSFLTVCLILINFSLLSLHAHLPQACIHAFSEMLSVYCPHTLTATLTHPSNAHTNLQQLLPPSHTHTHTHTRTQTHTQQLLPPPLTHTHTQPPVGLQSCLVEECQ